MVINYYLAALGFLVEEMSEETTLLDVLLIEVLVVIFYYILGRHMTASNETQPDNAFKSDTSDRSIYSLPARVGCRQARQHIAHQPASAKTILSNLKYHHAGHAPEGKLFRSSKMDEKWDIYHYDDTLLFVRSWRDQLVYRATVQFSDDEVHVLSIQYDSAFVESDEMATRGVDFLIRSHLFDLVTPAPIPSRLREDAKEIAAYLWKQYGTMVYYGAHGDTTRLISSIKLKRAR